MDEVVRAVIALKLSDEKKVAMPAGWPDNELIKERVIIPQANNVAEANEREGNCEGCDWRFWRKSLG